VQGAPNQLTTTFGVHVTRASVQDTINALTNSVNRVLSALHKQGVASKMIQTANLQLYRHYDSKGRATGFDASESVVARIKPLSHAGAAISQAATASRKDVSVDDMSFDVTDDQSLVGQARSAAFADARARAQQYADLANRSLGEVQKIGETVQASQPVPSPFYGREALDSATAGNALKSVPLQAGQQPVTVTVTVVWALR
jgi:uncharacterized protein YggE